MGGGAFSVQTEVLEQDQQLDCLLFEGQVGRYSVDQPAQFVESGAVTGLAHTSTYGRPDYGRSVTKSPLPTYNRLA